MPQVDMHVAYQHGHDKKECADANYRYSFPFYCKKYILASRGLEGAELKQKNIISGVVVYS